MTCQLMMPIQLFGGVVILVGASHAQGNALHAGNSYLMATNLATSTTAYQMRITIYFCKLVEVDYYVPTEFIYAVTALSFQFYTAINADTSVKRKLFASGNQRADFRWQRLMF